MNAKQSQTQNTAKIYDMNSYRIHPTAVIYDNVVLGDNVSIGPYSVIGGPAEVKTLPQDIRGQVYINSGTVIREHVTIHGSRSDDGATIIGNNCYIQAHAHIGHDAILHDNVTLSCYACVGGHAELHEHSNLALHAVTHPRCIIGKGTIVGCNSFAKGELKEWSVYAGNPAKWIKVNNYLREKLGLKPLKNPRPN